MTDGSRLDRDVAEVTELNADFYGAFERGDLDAMTEVWLDDPGSLCVHPGAEPLHGSGAITRSWALIMANLTYIQFFLTDVEVRVAGDAAYVTCTENILTGVDGTDDSTFSGGRAIATNVFLRKADTWRLWIHHASPVVSVGHHDD